MEKASDDKFIAFILFLRKDQTYWKGVKIRGKLRISIFDFATQLVAVSLISVLGALDSTDDESDESDDEDVEDGE